MDGVSPGLKTLQKEEGPLLTPAERPGPIVGGNAPRAGPDGYVRGASAPSHSHLLWVPSQNGFRLDCPHRQRK